jgi:hypothetical protein
MNTETRLPERKYLSEILFEHMDGSVSKANCEQIVKQQRLNEIRSYFGYFEGYLYKNINELSEQYFDEVSTAVKFFCRI